FPFVPFVIHHAAVAGVGEPNAAVGVDDDIVGRVKRFVLPFVRQDRERAVVFVADDAAIAVLAGELAAFVVEGVAVAVAARVAEHADVAVFVEQAHLAVVGNIAPEDVTADAVPGTTLGPQRATPELLNKSIADLVFSEPLVEHDDVRVGITHRIPPAPAPIAFGGNRGGTER